LPAIDSDAVVALMTTTHPHHAEARRQFDAASHIYLHPSVITEFTTVLRRQAKKNGLDGNAVAREALDTLLKQPRVTIELGIDHHQAADRYAKTTTLSFTDAVVADFQFHLDRQPPITFDAALAKLVGLKAAAGQQDILP
jgi:predicted nucleic acid-binding protein